ncbi:MAG: ankyrin repeat domain-containing protein [Acidobacteria bacterium]|nr:ankyrin repeat domain-containing protein [Acidobacteriota bacterium]
MSNLIIRSMGLPTRCEICHQFDLFDQESNFCARCDGLDLQFVHGSAGVHLPESEPLQLGFWGICTYLLVGGIGGAFVFNIGILSWAEFFQSGTNLIIAVSLLLGIWVTLLCIPVILDHAKPIEMTPPFQPAIEPGSVWIPIVKKQIHWRWILLMAASFLLTGVSFFLFLQYVTLNNTKLVEMINAGEAHKLDLLLQLGVNPNTIYEDTRYFSNTFLSFAIESQEVAVVEVLLQHHADPKLLVRSQKPQYNGQASFKTMLEMAASLGQSRSVSGLLRTCLWAEIEKNEALAAAVKNKHVSVAQTLLRVGADPNFSHNLPLHLAIRAGHLKMVKLLLAWGADPGIDEGSSLKLAKLMGEKPIFDELSQLALLEKPIPPPELKPQPNQPQTDGLLISLVLHSFCSEQLAQGKGNISIILTNVSGQNLKVWKTNYNDNRCPFRLEYLDEWGHSGFIYQPRNVCSDFQPTPHVLVPFESIEFQMRLNDSTWVQYPKTSEFSKDQILRFRAAYDCPKTDALVQQHFWTGVIATPWTPVPG